MKIRYPEIREGSEVLRKKSEVVAKRAYLFGEQQQLRIPDYAALQADILKPICSPTTIREGDVADPLPINEFFRDTEEDLRVVEPTTQVILESVYTSYNQVMRRWDALQSRIGELAGHLTALEIYSSNGDSPKKVYAFASEADMVQDGTEGCRINPGHGVLTLDEKSVQRIEVKTPILDRNYSTGIPGNSLDRTRGKNDSTEALIDDNRHTWYEQEAIGQSSLQVRLVIPLKTRGLINRVSLSLVNFGTEDAGQVYEVGLVSGTATKVISATDIERKGNILNGEARISFFPMECDSVYVILKQDEPHLVNGILRAALAIRDISVELVSYVDSGKFTLAPAMFRRAIAAVGLKAEAQEVGRAFDISYNLESNGESYKASDLGDSEGDEVVHLQSTTTEVSISGEISKNTEFFETGASEESSLVSVTEVQDRAASGNYILKEIPQSKVEVVELGVASMSDRPTAENKIGEVAALEERAFSVGHYIASQDLVVQVGSEVYDPVTTGSPGSKEYRYFFDGNESLLHINLTEAVIGEPIYAYIPSDRSVSVEYHPDGVIVVPSYQMDKVTETTEVHSRVESGSVFSMEIPAWVNYTRISRKHGLTGVPEVYTDSGIVFAWVPYQNGSAEFTASNQFSYNDRILFLSNGVSETVKVDYQFDHKVTVNPEEWEFVDGENAIFIPKSSVACRTETFSVRANSDRRAINIPAWNTVQGSQIAKRSIRSAGDQDSGLGTQLSREIDYIDGTTEFRRASNEVGLFSVDYEAGVIYLPEQDSLPEEFKGVLPGDISYEVASVWMFYNIGRSVGTFSPNGMELSLGARATNAMRGDGRVSLTYKARTVVDVSPDILEYYTPIIKSLTVYGSSIDRRVG